MSQKTKSLRRYPEVFLNYPYDQRYKFLRNAILFTVFACGFNPRSGDETTSSEIERFKNIRDLIKKCEFGIHDISRTTLNKSGLPRFNMPLELGIFMGAKYFGNKIQYRKKFLILDRDEHQHYESISDLSLFDVKAHGNSIEKAINFVREFLAPYTKERIPYPKKIKEKYCYFRDHVYAVECTSRGINVSGTPYNNVISIMKDWIRDNPL